MIELQDHIETDRLPQLMELFGSAWWTTSRTIEDVEAMLRGSELVFALVDRAADRLVGFARVITDDVYLAMVLDLIVAQDARKKGLGAVLMDAVIGHPRLKSVRSVELVCQPELVAFYRRWGFTDQVGLSRLMRLTTGGTPNS
ncbi:MAG TPA: GNAT family N-acetyltransferase [Micromonosporaceae bacterium]|nr:GNAT family N-acetyltransferase [Micromonosporaceae bacterium]HCU48867.1 GNAT family N-acetyltransferase [Micromonosporaceae bacterium]